MPITTPEFEKAYKQLNRQQREAVEAIEGPVMVVAGPGTGKTQILTLRIANILRQTDVPADAILALTFTEGAAFQMRKRLVEIIGPAGYRVHIGTFHSFCNEIIGNYPEEFPRIVGSVNIAEVDRIGILEEVISELKLSKLKPFGDNFFFVKPVLSKIAELKRENISPEELESSIKYQVLSIKKAEDLYHEKGAYKGQLKAKYKELEIQIIKHKELLEIYRAYEKKLSQRRFYDYEDMILEVVRTLEKNQDLLLRLQENYQYILADEHQDANNAQNRLLELLTSFHKSPNLFIVGDEKQAIFRFQGASLENFLYFQKRHSNAKLVRLTQNYRSTQKILDSAHSLVSRSDLEVAQRSDLRPILAAARAGQGEGIKLFEFSKPGYEYQFLAADLWEKLKTGARPDEITVLYRNNDDALPVMAVLDRTHIPYVVESDQDVLSDELVRKLVILLETVAYFGEDERLLPALHLDLFELDPLAVWQAANSSHKIKKPFYEVVKKKFPKVYRLIKSWHSASRNKNPLETLEIIVRESGLLSQFIADQRAAERVEKLTGLYDELQAFVERHKVADFHELVGYLEKIRDHGVTIKKDSRGTRVGKVRLMTAHRAKGLEFDFVYIINAHDGHWGNQRTPAHFKLGQLELDKTADERRLFYVALTRARHGVVITYSKESRDGKMQLPSQFVQEIEPALVEKVPTEKLEKRFEKEKTRIFQAPVSRGHSLAEKEFLNQLFRDQGLSVTALNNYLDCPWNYFYSNLIRVPKVPDKHLSFGSAVHETLKVFFDKWRKGEDWSKERLLEYFEGRLADKPLTEAEFGEARDKGKKALEGYYENYKNHWPRQILNEFKIDGVHVKIAVRGLPELKLHGILDKIEILNARNEVNVVDYKPGKPRSRNWIEGTHSTRSARSGRPKGRGAGNYKRQLVFYNLLLDLFEGSRRLGRPLSDRVAKYPEFKMASGEIDFIEPDARGRFHKERFEVTDEEKKELVETINRASREILNLAFWNRKCADPKCQRCKLRQLM